MIDISILSLSEKEELFKALGEQIRKEKDVETQRARTGEEVIAKVCEVMKIDSFNSQSRLRQHVVSRVIVSNILIQMGHTESGIGRIINKDHSSVHKYKDILQDWLAFPQYYANELSIYEQVKATI